ncbi:MAG: Smr/MutS family protein, partial [Bacteroidota bacterium]
LESYIKNGTIKGNFTREEARANLDNADMLRIQLDKFHSVMKENINKKGQKIVFIHGKGEGVLRKEITELLRKQYKNASFQDASFQQYGFGATQVNIH